MKQDIENIIKKNLPEKRELKECGKCNSCEMMMACEVLYADRQFNQALSQIDTSLIADEVLKVVVEKIDEEAKYISDELFELLPPNLMYKNVDRKSIYNWLKTRFDGISKELLSNLSTNKEN